MKIETTRITCKRCGHEWTPRKEEVRVCPKCHSVYFDLDKKSNDGEVNNQGDNK